MVKLSDLDRTDREVLAELDRDCRQSNAEIARKLRLGKHVVSYRIAQLEKSNAISGYYAMIDLSKLGKLSYRAYLKFYAMAPREREAVFDYLMKKDTWWVGELDGEWDVGFVMWARDHYEFEKFWGAFASRFQKHVEKYNISIYLRFHTYSMGFLSERDQERVEYMVGLGGEAKTDAADLRILSVIAGNARIGTVEIAEKAGLSPVQVAYRLKNLVKRGVITGFRANVSLEDLTLYKANFHLNSTRKVKDMHAFAREEKWAVYSDESIGFAEFEYDLLCPSYVEFKKAVERFQKAFSSEIVKYDFQVYGKSLKMKYF